MNIRKQIPVSTAEFFSGVVCLLAFFVLIMGSRLSRLSDAGSISSERPVHLYLYDNTELSELSEILADSGVVESKKELMWAGRLLGWNNFRSGHYLVDGNYSYDVFLSRMARGIQDPVQLTILPGRAKQRLVGDIAADFKFDSLDLAATLTDSSFLAAHDITAKNWPGHMLPDTYSLYWNATPQSVIQRILKEFETKVQNAYTDRLDELGRSLDDIITLASIIEWEVRHDEEKPTVSGLYWNRLQRGMRLQADPTVNFALGERRRLLYEDYKTEHPYNTYLHSGLPPGPITNPALSSIEAALFPEDHSYLYMVANPEGYHLFSETYEEHQEKSEKWRKWLREQYRLKEEREREQKNTEDAR